MKSSGITYVFVLRIPSSEFLTWKNFPDFREEIRCGQELCEKYLCKTVSLPTADVKPDVGSEEFPGWLRFKAKIDSYLGII